MKKTLLAVATTHPQTLTWIWGQGGNLVRRTLRLTPCLLFAFASVMFAPQARALTIISNLDGNDGTSSAALSEFRNKAMGFTIPFVVDYFLDSVTLRLNTSGTSSPIVEIWNDVAGMPASALVTLTNPTFGVGIANYDFTPPSPFVLANDTTYWLVAYAAAGGYDWMANDPGIIPTGIATHAGQWFGFSGPPPALGSSISNSYEIAGSVVPEPSAALLFGVGLLVAGAATRRELGLAARRRRRKA